MDTYTNFAALRSAEPKAAWRTIAEHRGSTIAVIAPHGGGIEAGTSEVARALAGEDLSLYLFEGLKTGGNDDLHITSENFDEPLGVALVESSETVVAVHGAKGTESVVYLGGRDEALGTLIRHSLLEAGFDVKDHPRLKGALPQNICNRGKSGRGVQLELTRGLREKFFADMTRTGRRQRTPVFQTFVTVVRSCFA